MSPAAQRRAKQLLQDDPLGEENRFAAFERQVEATAHFAQDAVALAAIGCPSLAPTRVIGHGGVTNPDGSGAPAPPSGPGTPRAPAGGGASAPPEPIPGASGASADADGLEAMVRLYLDNVRLPFPEDARQALSYRDHPRIADWRAQIVGWQQALSSGQLDMKLIRAEIDDANSYIAGVSSLRTVIGRLPAIVTTPAAVALELAPESAWKRLAQLGLLAFDVVRLVPSALLSPSKRSQDLRYGWLLVEPPNPSQGGE